MKFWRRSARRADAARVEPTIEASTSFLSSDAEAWDRILPGGLPGSVSPETAMRHAAVYRCVSIIAFAAAMLPLKTYRELDNGDREASAAHPAADLLRIRPNPRLSRTMWLRATLAQMLLEGNAVSWIERKGSGDPVALWPVPFHRVAISLNGERLRYRLQLDDGRLIVVDQDDVLHIPGSSEWDGLKANTPIQAMGAAVGLGIEADRFAKEYFENDATPSGYIKYPAKYAGDKDELRGFWGRTFGRGRRHSGPAVLDQGGEYVRIPISAQDAQLLDTRRFQIEDIARIFGVPRFLLGMDETSWGSGIEALGIGFVTYTLDPHLCAIEDEVNHKLYGRGRPARPGPNPPRYLAEFDRDVLVRGNIESRFKAYRQGLGGSSGPGWMTINEVRRKQNLPARSDGDTLTPWPGQGPATPTKADDGQDPPAAD
ncbi:phage portal protein [Methylobacterium nodulans]|uniref:Phage portal protein, HK97 family n=1 Tax=Methylobacterium nodulans (strain LMG 21967 / CNCM I-2342 / ORS 2060) TaxID=460265 RepID=B8ILU5_METNO|nr:phage portal protein [Methylobacterium nodulans]ACL62070.1 phage portal protein, HK97 family [Methylobacterium nodulans ORS 2060]